jgi:hypothetical protein
MFSQDNRSKLNAFMGRMNDWSNDDAFDMADAFQYADASAMPSAVAPRRMATSMPYIFTVTSTDAATQTVVLFGSEKNRTATNFGNPVTIQISYDLTGYYGGGTTGYSALLGRTESQPLTIGRIRLESSSAPQLSAPITVADVDPTGKATVYPIVNFKKLNQYDQTAVETECDTTIYGGTQLSYNQLAGTTIRFYFYAADVASLTRGIEGKAVIKELKRPDTLLSSMVTVRG